MGLRAAIGALIALSAMSAPTVAPADLADRPSRLVLATATPGGGFPIYGDAAAAEINRVDPTLSVETRNTNGSIENLNLLEESAVELALVAGPIAQEALLGVGRPRTNARIITAIYSSVGAFAVGPGGGVVGVSDLVGKRIAWGTPDSGLTALGKLAMAGLGLDIEKDFIAVFPAKAGDAAAMLARGDVEAIWGGGVGWPNFQKALDNGGALIGFSEAEIARILESQPTLRRGEIAAGSYFGQMKPVRSVATWSFVLASPKLDDDTAYRFAKALFAAREALAKELPQALETTTENLSIAAPRADLIHPGVARLLSERRLAPN